MEFTADRRRLQEALQIVGGVAMLRTLKDVLQNVYIEARDNTLVLKATDYEVGIKITLNDVNVKKEGTILLPSAKTVGIFREINEPSVTVKSDGTRCRIQAGRSRFAVVQYDPEQFPGLPDYPTQVAVKVPRESFLGMIRQVSFASADERTRYAFDGIKLKIESDQMRMVATDGKRLAYHWIPMDEQSGGTIDALLPSRSMTHFLKALGNETSECEIGVEGNRFAIRTGHIEVYCQQIEGTFPNFEPLINKKLPFQVDLDSEELHAALRKASLFAGSETRVVRMKLSPGNLSLNSGDADMGEAETDLPVEFEGDEVVLGFNPDYLVDYLKTVGSGTVRLSFQDDETASRWSSGEHFLYLVMPVSS